jgi:hypothetical protein
MSSPFNPVPPTGRPAFTPVLTVAGNFSKINVTGAVSVPEEGYGQDGYGQGGYDAPAVNIPASSQPIWTVETLR